MSEIRTAPVAVACGSRRAGAHPWFCTSVGADALVLSAMETRFVGGTGVRLSAVGLGAVEFCGGLGSRGEPTLREASAAVAAAIASGVNWVDTAEVYYEGRNEKFLGEVLHEVGGDLLVSTKLAPRPDWRWFSA